MKPNEVKVPPDPGEPTRREGPSLAALPGDIGEELEFLRAMEEYCRRNDRPFPTWGEVLGVLRQLGYAKQPAEARQGSNGKDWQALCASLLKERDELHLQVKTLREERRYVTNALGHLMFGEVEIDKEAMLKEA